MSTEVENIKSTPLLIKIIIIVYVYGMHVARASIFTSLFHFNPLLGTLYIIIRFSELNSELIDTIRDLKLTISEHEDEFRNLRKLDEFNSDSIETSEKIIREMEDMNETELNIHFDEEQYSCSALQELQQQILIRDRIIAALNDQLYKQT